MRRSIGGWVDNKICQAALAVVQTAAQRIDKKQMRRAARGFVEKACRRRESFPAPAPGRADCACTAPPWHRRDIRAGATPPSPTACAISGDKAISSDQRQKDQRIFLAHPPRRSARTIKTALAPVGKNRDAAEQERSPASSAKYRRCGYATSRAPPRPGSLHGRAAPANRW